MDFLLIQFLEGLACASPLFLMAAGLSLIFRTTGIVNFAHGSLYTLGAYVAWSLAAPLGFWLAMPLSALTVGMLGAMLEFGLLRRVYKRPELLQLLATVAVALIVADLVPLIWGQQMLLTKPAPGLSGSVALFERDVPTYNLFLIFVGPLVMGGLWLLRERSRFGMTLRAGNGEKTAGVGTAVFALGAALAGLGGALEMPLATLNGDTGASRVLTAFAVVVVGGLDSLFGAFLAALLIGQVLAFGCDLFPQSTPTLIFVVMAVMLAVRPRGLLGSPVPTGTNQPASLAPLTASHRFVQCMLAALAAATLLPLVGNDQVLSIASEILILGLFAASLLLVTGLGGMTSFGHAAWFGIGAYTAALSHPAIGMLGAIFLAPLVAAMVAFGFARVAVRLSGIYLAMLTLAFAEIVHELAGQAGMLAATPAEWAQPPVAYYYLTLLLAGTALALLWRLHGSPFGFGLRAVRDSALRAEALGINAARQRWYGFAAGAGLAGAAGGLFSFLEGITFPDMAAITTSFDALAIIMLGGIGSLAGPLIGAATYVLLRTGLSDFANQWHMTVGILILLLVLALPRGLIGARRP